MEPNIQAVILRGLMTEPEYAKKYLPYLNPSYISISVTTDDDLGIGGSLVLGAIKSYVQKYDGSPSKEQLIIELESLKADAKTINVNVQIAKRLDDIAGPPVNIEWLSHKTEHFIRQSHEHQHFLEMVQASTKGQSIAPFFAYVPPTFEPTALEGIYSKAPDFMNQLRAWNRRANTTIPFDIQALNDAVYGVKRQSLNIVLAGTNCGKTLVQCHFAAMYLKQGLNVLYLTMELSDELIYNRITANLLDIALEPDSKLNVPDDVELPERLGGLIVRRYPTGMGHTGLFRSYIAELWKDLQFKPDVILVDYLAICASERMSGNSVNQQYVVIGSISKELKALAQTTDTVLWTAAQSNRSGLTRGTQLNLTHFAGSVEMSYDADIILALWVPTEESVKDKFYHCSIEKHQSGSGANKRVMLVVDRAKQRLTDTSVADQKRYEEFCNKLTTVMNQNKSKKKTDAAFDIDNEE